MIDFDKSRSLIENEFEEAQFDPATGLDAETLREKLSEFIKIHEGKYPMPILRAKAYALLLENVQIQINPHTIFADKLNIGIDYTSFATNDLFEKTLFWPTRARVLSEKLGEEYAHAQKGIEISVGAPYADFWHTVPNWPNILELGFAGILAKAKECKQIAMAQEDCTAEKIHFYDGIIICYEAILNYYRRVYEYSLQFDIPEYSENILYLIDNPPETLYQVMLTAIMFLYMEEIGTERARSLGPIDRLYYPYYKKELEKGTSVEQIREYFKFFFIHFTATKRFAQQPFTLGGADAEGNSYVNELTELILDVYDSMNILDPKIHFRYHKGIKDTVMLKILDMIRRGNSSICLINDEVVLEGYARIGIPKEDAVNYVALGCYEPIIMGKEEAEIGAAWLNMAKALEFALNEGKDIATGYQYGPVTPSSYGSYEEFYQGFLTQLDNILQFSLKHILDQSKFNQQINPSPLYSSTFTQCLEKGMDVHEYPLEYNNLSIKCFAIATVVDSLMAVKKFVFDQGTVTYEEMKQAVLANWDGYEELRRQIRKDEEKFGNNLPGPDQIMVDLVTHLTDFAKGVKLERGGVLRFGMDSITNNLWDTYATPDGRNAGEALSRNLCPTSGMDKKGITAYMNSMLKLDHADLLDSAILDYMVHPSAVQGEKGLQDFYSLVRAYFGRGGFALQGNIVDTSALRDAQLHPEKYSTLQIRVCGWNEYFVNMPKEKQDLFIGGK